MTSSTNLPLRDFIGITRKTPRGVGIEIELESSNAMPPIEAFEMTSWTKHMDGSLRGFDSAEFVLSNPRAVSNIPGVLEELRSVIKNHGTKVNDSVRAGTHIHYDVCNLTFKEFFTFVTVWYTLEELLSTQFGEGRQGNHFCLRAVDAEWLIDVVCNAAHSANLKYLKTNEIRYATLNLTSLFKYGTIEFRALRGSLDTGYINRWVRVIHSVVTNSALFEDPQRVITNFSAGGEREFVRHVLGPEEAGSFMSNPEARAMLRRGIRLAQEVAYARMEW